MSFTLAIVGRPNVGKSTLFNRLVGKRLALVDDQPGVTRDLRECEARLGDLTFTVVDTAGLEEASDGSLPARMRAAVALHHVAGLTVPQTAEVLGTRENTVKSQLREGLSRLRAALAEPDSVTNAARTQTDARRA